MKLYAFSLLVQFASCQHLTCQSLKLAYQTATLHSGEEGCCGRESGVLDPSDCTYFAGEKSKFENGKPTLVSMLDGDKDTLVKLWTDLARRVVDTRTSNPHNTNFKGKYTGLNVMSFSVNDTTSLIVGTVQFPTDEDVMRDVVHGGLDAGTVASLIPLYYTTQNPYVTIPYSINYWISKDTESYFDEPFPRVTVSKNAALSSFLPFVNSLTLDSDIVVPLPTLSMFACPFLVISKDMAKAKERFDMIKKTTTSTPYPSGETFSNTLDGTAGQTIQVVDALLVHMPHVGGETRSVMMVYFASIYECMKFEVAQSFVNQPDIVFWARGAMETIFP